MSTELLIALACSFLGIGYGVFTIFNVLSKPMGNEEMVRIQSAIQEGAQAYLKRQYTAIAAVGVIVYLVVM
ncbi:MAG: sodium/proton-translocating pyrophosphatase, partial [Gammaproteobacteria bacterium]|nr:sodium/proton-translocating pyrophosphatase [Gammaproteobacteria bacterium]